MRLIRPTFVFACLLACSASGLAGCSDSPPPATDESVSNSVDTTPDVSASDPGPGRGWSRDLAFVELDSDSALIFPWQVRATEMGDSLRWERTFRLGYRRGWELLASDTLVSGPMRAPWRILPGGPLRIVVGPQDALTSLLVRSPTREAELRPEELLTEWSRSEGGAVRLLLGTGRLETLGDPESAREVEGLVLDLTRTWEPGGSLPGGWILLHAGPATQIFMEARPTDEGLARPYRAWTRIAFQTRSWPRLEVEWTETRSYERARRDIPQQWSIRSGGGQFEGELEALGAHLAAGTGPGPILPVDGVFQVSGELSIQGERIPVTGIVYHVQR